MKAVSLRLEGRLLTDGSQAAILLTGTPATASPDAPLVLRFAFVTRGPEEHLFPAFLLDDWGKEVRGPALYRWVADYGEQFPRAEVFGYDRQGSETQFFLRELELYARLPCYAFRDKQQPLQRGVLIEAILQPDPAARAPERLERPPDLERPLAVARVSWWRVPPETTRFDPPLALPPDPGF